MKIARTGLGSLTNFFKCPGFARAGMVFAVGIDSHISSPRPSSDKFQRFDFFKIARLG